MNNNQQDRKTRKWLVLLTIPMQMGATIFVFSWFGGWLDEKYGNTNSTNQIIFALLGVFLSLYYVIKQVNQLNK
ncbi:MAG: AtpZ/AtpI family protein [Flavobacterium sp.]|nr:MAG: AtpZ/AtpI family protein [Flavobacterium sp.]